MTVQELIDSLLDMTTSESRKTITVQANPGEIELFNRGSDRPSKRVYGVCLTDAVITEEPKDV